MVFFPSSHYAIVERLPGSILLETARFDQENRQSYLFVNPVCELKLDTLDGVPTLFRQIEDCLSAGLFLAGFMTYECGFHFEPNACPFPLRLSALPLAWFGAYERPFVFDHATGRFAPELPRQCQELVAVPREMARFSLANCRLAMAREEYGAKVEKVRDYIAAGDTYQVNLTSKLKFDFSGSPEACFAALRDRQRVAYAALLRPGPRHVLSLSPELFFRLRQGRITTRPMKGTASRGVDLREDERLRSWLQGDVKNRSENVMIVDLMRNDLGKVAQTGSVQVDDLFAVEKYETLLQMTSTVSAALRPDTPFYEIFRALFPCGSITGAPKIRTMQIIRELEDEARGVYTGTIGYFSPNREAVFSVAIRTLVLDEKSGEMGVGSGIVYDSVAQREYEECLLKTQFLNRSQPDFHLLESLRWDGEYYLLQLHLERLCSSAEYFAFSWDENEVKRALEQVQERFQRNTAYKVRLLLDRAGKVLTESIPHTLSSSNGTVVIAAMRTFSQDRFLYHKTTCREFYDRLHAQASRHGHEDVIFLNEREEVTEGARNNIFVEICGKLLTPPAECGLLPGTLRQHLLQSDPRVSERVLRCEDLLAAEAIYLGNSVRGLRQVVLQEPELF